MTGVDGAAGRRLRRIASAFPGPRALVWSVSAAPVGIVRLRLALVTTLATAVVIVLLVGRHRDSRLPHDGLGMTPAPVHWVRPPASPLSAGRRLTCFGLYPR